LSFYFVQIDLSIIIVRLLFVGDDVKREHDLDATEEEVITSSIDTDFSDYMSDPKLTPGFFSGIDLSDPQQLASFAKYVISY